MLTYIIALLLRMFWFPSQEQVENFRATAPGLLTAEDAEEHLIAAHAAGLAYGVREELLLSIAHHESRYIPTTRTREPGRRESCGVMTPVPKRRCSADELTILGGYDAGAAHLRVWLDAYDGHEHPALLAYAGGGGLVRVCRRFGRWIAHGKDVCEVSYDFRRRARIIHQALHPQSERRIGW